MKDSPYNGMFRISPAKRKFYDKKTKLITEHGVKEKCKFDLQNGAIYDLDGKLIKQDGQRFYNSCFLVAVFHLKINNIKDFFNYHFDYTPNKETFLDYLEFGILSDTTIDKGTMVFFQKLIDEKRKGLVEHSIKLKETIIQLLKDELIKNYKVWKQKLNNPLATELQFLEIEKAKCEDAILKYKVKNNKLFHGEPNIVLYNETNFLAKLNIINERIKELAEPQQSIKDFKSIESKEPENKHRDIFENGYAFKLFLEWNKLYYRDTKNHLANYSYFIRKMISDKLIKDIKLTHYYTMLSVYNVNIDRLKTISDCETIAKKNSYLTLKQAIINC